MTAPRFLLPADEGFLGDLFSLDEPLLMWLADATQGAVDGDEDAWRLPAGLDGTAVYDAFIRLVTALPEGLREWWTALSRGGSEDGIGNTVLGVDGYEYTPVYAADLDPADVAALVGLLGHCRRALAREDGYTDLHSLLDDAAEWSANEGDHGPRTATQVVDRLARVVAVLELRDDDTDVLLSAVAAGGRVRLTGPQEEAMRRYSANLVVAVTEGKSNVERAYAAFVAFG